MHARVCLCVHDAAHPPTIVEYENDAGVVVVVVHFRKVLTIFSAGN